MGLFKRKQEVYDTVSTESAQKAKVRDENEAYKAQTTDFLLHRLSDYMDEEVNLSGCMDAIMARTTETKMQLGSISEVIDSISRNYSQFHECADEINQVIEDSDMRINESDQSMNELTDQIEGSKNQLLSMTNTFGQLESDFNNITTLTKNIAGISSRTNLLALNASIEAGRGFAVVADQIRELSASTASLVSGIDESIGVLKETMLSLQKEIGKTSDMMQANIEAAGGLKQSMEQVKDCTGQVRSVSGRIIDAISASDNQIEEAIDGIQNTHNAVDGIEGEVTNLNQKSSEKSTVLCEIDDILYQFKKIYSESSR